MVGGGGVDVSARHRDRDVQYGFSSHGNSHYADIDIEDLGSYSDTAPAATNRTSTDSSSSDDGNLAAQKRELATHFQHDYPDMEETITFDHRSSENSGRQRSNQEYYNILEMASNRLREDGSVHDDSSGDEAVRRKKKKKKSKTKREKRNSRRKVSEFEQHNDVNKDRRSTIFPSLFPPMMNSRKDKHAAAAINLAENEDVNYIKDIEVDPNDDLPTFTTGKSSQWNPAALVTAAHANDKIDRNGFYKSMKERADLAYGRVQSLKTVQQEVKSDEYNLKNIGKTRGATYQPVPRGRNIVWGDESILTRDDSVVDHEIDAEKSIRRIDDRREDFCPSELKQSMERYKENEKLVQNLMWREKRRRIGAILLASITVFGTCLGVYLSRRGKGSSFTPPSTQLGENNDVDRKDPPPRPLPPSPSSFDEVKSSNVQVITETELQYIVNTITTDKSVFDNPHTPQSKALKWFQNDMHNYNGTTEARVAQRYALATLYYSTNGTGWQTRSEWGSGHECDWYGVGCEAGENESISVTYLDLNNNLLDGTIPPEIGYIITLEQIHLWGNNLVGSIPNTFSQLVNLHTLYLDKNYLDGEMSDIFNSMKSLKHLDLSHNRLRGHIPHGLGSIINLRDVRLSNNLLSSSLPSSFISLSNLQTLLLDSNAISGSLPSLMGDMRSLVTLRLHGNDIEGHLPNFLNAINLEEAHFDGNYFSGTIPTFGSTRLRELYLGQNSLTGSIPDSIGDLIKLEIFTANGNGLSSSIPSTLSKATQLNILDLSNNRLSGEIPHEFAELIMLHELRLDHNRLRGFPDWLGSMSHIQIVHLNNNLLDGMLNLPLDVGELNDLTEFAIQNNDLTGVVDEFMCDLLLNVLTSDCWGSPPRVDCPCCTECF